MRKCIDHQSTGRAHNVGMRCMKEQECCRVIRIVRIAIHTGTAVVSDYESQPDTIIRIWIRKGWMTMTTVEMTWISHSKPYIHLERM